MTRNKHYYDLADDLTKDTWLTFVVGGRNTGKTYSALKYCVQNNLMFAFVKRTNDDVKMLCSGSTIGGVNVNFSPFNALNRDNGWNIHPHSISKGIGGFWEFGEKGPEGFPVGYILSLNNLKDIKGFEFPRMIDVIIFDEFIPQPWEKVNRREGQQVMDLYKTLERDRTHRGMDPLRMVMLANAVRVSNPIFNFFELTDDFAEMQIKEEEYRKLQDRGFLLHLLKNSEEFNKVEQESPVYKAMIGTDWGRMAYENKFGYDDFSNVAKVSLKGCRAVCGVQYKSRTFYIYMKEGVYQMTTSASNRCRIYNLNRENEQKAFFRDELCDMRDACIDDKMIFESYSMYDLIMN